MIVWVKILLMFLISYGRKYVSYICVFKIQVNTSEYKYRVILPTTLFFFNCFLNIIDTKQEVWIVSI